MPPSASTRVALRFDEAFHPGFLAHGQAVRLIDVTADVRLRTPQGWSKSRGAILDTGCQVTLLPRWIWSGITFRDLGLPAEMIAVVGVQVPARLAEVECRLVDAAAISPTLVMRAFLCESDDVPALLGVEDFLTQCVFVCDHAAGQAYVDFPQAKEPAT